MRSLLNSFGTILKRVWKRMPLFFLILVTIVVMSLTGLIGEHTGMKQFSILDFSKEPFFAVTLFQIRDTLNGSEEVLVPPSVMKKSAASKHAVPDSSVKHEKQKIVSGSVRLTIPEGVNNPVVPAVDYGVANRSIMVDPSTVFTADTTGLFAPNGQYRYLEKSKDDSYFADALMIGDSRTVGLASWSSLTGKTNFFCKESMSVFGLESKELNYSGIDGNGNPETGSTTLDNLLSSHHYGKVYICLGINEMGYPVMDYYNAYRALVEKIHTAEPDAIIYIEGNMHVSAAKSQADPTFNNTNLVQRNMAIASLANGRDTFYIDPNSAVCDGNGDLIADDTSDGVHLKASCYNLWADFLRANTIDPKAPLAEK